jgi:Domain of unknown function (DUF5916)
MIVQKYGTCARRAIGHFWSVIGRAGIGLFFLRPLCVPCQFFHAQSQASSQTRKAQSGSQEPLRIAQASRVDRAPRMDGTPDDALWNQATPIINFLQREPYEGQAPTEHTEVRILYTKERVYFGISCFDSDPKGIVATELRRDVSQELDDYFEIVIDSAHDRRNAYVFQINPLGTQRDALVTEEQITDSSLGDGDSGWDGIWVSEARITEHGWTATVAIPFATLNFMQSRDVIWGINFKRFIRRKNEEDLWSGWRRVYGAARISQAGDLRGISEIGSGRLFIVKPYGLTGFNHLPATAAGTGLTPGMSALHTGGVDVKLGLRSNLVANFTVNTDFADADVDTQQFNLTPYKLFFPEKRQFFLENAGVFNFPLGGDSGDLLFFSRQIGIDPITGEQVPINAGAKVTGSLGNFELGVMDVNTRSSGPNPYANYAVTRVKRSLWGGSYIGVMGIDKRSGNHSDSFNQISGADTRLVFFRNLVVNGYAAQTRTPGFSSGQTNVGAGFDYQTNWLEILAQHRKVGPNFNPEVVSSNAPTAYATTWIQLLSPGQRFAGSANSTSKVSYFTPQTRTMSFRRRSGKAHFVSNSTTEPTATTTSWMSSRSGSPPLSTFTRTFSFQRVNTTGLGISSLTGLPRIAG